jgi:hypothetical protein
MDEEATNAAFDKWADEYGYMATEIYEEIKETSHLLDITDSNHAKWHEDSLGVLVVLPYEHAMAFAVENMMSDFENSPLHNHVFSTVTGLIMNSVEAIGETKEN